MRKMLIKKKVLFLTVILSFIVGCGGGGTVTSTSDATPTVQVIALDKIMVYAEDGSKPAPTLQDYIDAGVSGVTSENLAELNAVLDTLEQDDVDTIAELDALTAKLGINIEDVQFDDVLVKATTDNITVYVKSENSSTLSNHFLEYNLVYMNKPDVRMDLWRLIRLFDVTPTESSEPLSFSRNYFGEAIANGGEWECAIHETGAPDWMGGIHGYEELVSYTLEIDGEEVSDFSELELEKAKEVNFFQESELISQLTGEVAAKHTKEYSFTSERVQVKQVVDWEIATSINRSYLAMLPIKRTLYNSPDVQITDEAYRDGSGIFEYIATNDFVLQYTADEMLKITGSESGFFGEISISRNPQLPGYSSFVSNASQYNKLYFDFSSSHTTSAGEKWETTTTYNLFIDQY